MTTDHVEPVGLGGECEREPGPSDSLRTFGAVVQALREHAGLSRVEFGEIVRFSKHTVESVELGRRMPDASFVERGGAGAGQHGGAAALGAVPDPGGGGAGDLVPAVGSAGAGGGESVYV